MRVVKRKLKICWYIIPSVMYNPEIKYIEFAWLHSAFCLLFATRKDIEDIIIQIIKE